MSREQKRLCSGHCQVNSGTIMVGSSGEGGGGGEGGGEGRTVGPAGSLPIILERHRDNTGHVRHMRKREREREREGEGEREREKSGGREGERDEEEEHTEKRRRKMKKKKKEEGEEEKYTGVRDPCNARRFVYNYNA